MRYPATEKLEIIRLVEGSHLPARQTLDKLGIPRPTFYRWYDRFQTHGVEGVNRRRNGTPYRLPKGTPASSCIGSARVGPGLSI